jgi:hypothetical protein
VAALPGALFALRFVPVRARLAVAEGDERPVFPLAALVDRVTDFALAPPLERVADFAPVTRLVPDREPARLVAMLTIFARNMPWAPKWGLTPRGLTPPTTPPYFFRGLAGRRRSLKKGSTWFWKRSATSLVWVPG